MTEAPEMHPTEGQRWEGEMGEKWNARHEQFEGMIGPAGRSLIEAGRFRPGEAVIDVGCGAGGAGFDIARLVGAAGSVTGLDISPLLIETAKRRAQAFGLTNIDFIAGDAATITIDDRYDCLFSRFGVMFFEDPPAAFANMRPWMKPDGRLLFSCWGPMQENQWVTDVVGVVARYKELPPPVPRAPGPFALAEIDYTREILERAGFNNVEFTPWCGDQFIGGPGLDAQQAAGFLMDALFVGEMLEDDPQEMRDRIAADLVVLLRRFELPDGVCIPGMAWFVSGTA